MGTLDVGGKLTRRGAWDSLAGAVLGFMLAPWPPAVIGLSLGMKDPLGELVALLVAVAVGFHGWWVWRKARILRFTEGDDALGHHRGGAMATAVLIGALWTLAWATELKEHGWEFALRDWSALVMIVGPAAAVHLALHHAAARAAPSGMRETLLVPDDRVSAVAARPIGQLALVLLATHWAATLVAGWSLEPLAAIAGPSGYVSAIPWLFLGLGLLIPLPAWWLAGAGNRGALASAGLVLIGFAAYMAGMQPRAATSLASLTAVGLHLALIAAAVRAARERATRLGAAPAPRDASSWTVAATIVGVVWLSIWQLFLEPAQRGEIVRAALRPGMPARDLAIVLRVAEPWYTGGTSHLTLDTFFAPPGSYGVVGGVPQPSRAAFERELAAHAPELARTERLSLVFLGFTFAKQKLEARFDPSGHLVEVLPINNVD